jgi:hypothetical protein
MHHGIGAKVAGRTKLEAGKEFFHFMGSEKLGWFRPVKYRRSHHQRRKIALDQVGLVVQIPQKAPKVGTIGSFGSLGKWCKKLSQETIEVLDAQVAKVEVEPLQVVMKGSQDSSDMVDGAQGSLTAPLMVDQILFIGLR